jgi:hypothetical protein
MKKLFTGLLTALTVILPTATLAQASIPSIDIARKGNLASIFNAAITTIETLAGAVAVLYIIYGGFVYMTSSADKGKDIIVNGLVGLAIIILAFVLVNFVKDLF